MKQSKSEFLFLLYIVKFWCKHPILIMHNLLQSTGSVEDINTQHTAVVTLENTDYNQTSTPLPNDENNQNNNEEPATKTIGE